MATQPVSRYVVLAYDDGFSIEFLNRRLRPWWRRNGAEAGDLLADAIKDYDRLNQRAREFDDALMTDLRKAGGEQYARLAALAYRQALAAHKLVADLDGTPLLFSKENFSNGCIATVDVTYPSSPFFLLFSPTLLRAHADADDGLRAVCRGGAFPSRRTTSARIRWRTARSTAAESRPKRTRCRSKRAATCC